ncbi:MAG TPA: Fur family transcriptional regulator [Actinomycetota bacterium]|nr:Fur family transcriptional regulator [Actinomycetota bacterium]
MSRPHRFPDVHGEAVTRLRSIGQRSTPNRRALIEVLVEANRPLTATEILERRRSLPQSSTYRNLLALEQAGVVRRVTPTDEYSRYELAEDLIGHHHHLVCSSCGSVEDFTAPQQLEHAVARTIGEITSRSGFSAQSHHVQLRGVCRNCS